MQSFTQKVCRNPACAVPLQAAWAFCPVCGTQTSGIETAQDLAVVIPPNFQREYSIAIDGSGPRPVRARVEWLDVPEGFEPLPVRAAEHGASIRFRLGDAFQYRAHTLMAALISQDGPRDARWVLQRERRQGLRIKLQPEAPGQLTCNEEAVVLRWDRPAREIHLRNSGGRALRLRHVDVPVGVVATDLADRPLDDINMPQWSLEPGRDTLIRVKLVAGAHQTPSHLRLVTTEGEPVEIELFLPDAPRGGFQPRFVVGVDVGTENASVYCRDLSDGSVFAVTLEGAATRIPCYMAFNDFTSEEPVAYGKSAVDRLVLGRGIVVRDLKIHLRHGRQVYAQQYGDAFRTENLLYHLLSHLKHEVETFLERRAGAVTSIRWSFTLPVLGDAAAFDTLRRKYRAVLRRVFQREIRDGAVDPDEAFGFLTEPEAAALYVFQRLGQDVPTLLPRPFRDGDVVCVLDAGAGTTDVALMRMRIRDGQQTFEILGEVGTDLPTTDTLHADDFGGRGADLLLVECLARGSLKGGHATPENVDRQMRMLLGEGSADPSAARNRALQAAMEAKHQLCAAASAAATVAAGTSLAASGTTPGAAGGSLAASAMTPATAGGSLAASGMTPAPAGGSLAASGTAGVAGSSAGAGTSLAAAPSFASAGRSGGSAVKVDVRDSAWPDLDRTIPGEVTLKRFHLTVAPALDRILARMEEVISRCGLTRRDVGWVFAIGGSSNVPLVEERLQQLFPGRVISLEQHRDVRMEAVARGAVWSWRARLTNVAPLDVALQVRRGGEVQRQAVLFRDRPLTMRAQEYHFELVDEAAVELVGVRDGRAWRLTGLTIDARREPHDVAIMVRCADGALQLEARVNGTTRVAPPAWLA